MYGDGDGGARGTARLTDRDVTVIVARIRRGEARGFTIRV